MELEFKYSKEWQPYLGYDKQEYDIKLKDGRIFENCYPNGGYFNPLDHEKIHESEVAEIRYSVNEKMYINHNEVDNRK
ncbi:hypothetical protein [Elizabethkingia anophelis]|uniref:hypothetical protein n=1 Tax=Elizabethkingia anophelis TaxID=1117645 RepID=UPI0023E97BFA|nr:hypothetical protein [Elizabethkingia anophelis]GJN60454.1 hypothetical protein ELAK_06040 [Elizabethkingia anophelis]HDP3254018.1 hypothetical protein [Elizabethkingia anophelis]